MAETSSASNPVLTRVLEHARAGTTPMTLGGVIGKSAALFALMLAAAVWSYAKWEALVLTGAAPAWLQPATLAAACIAIGGMITASFRPALAAPLAPVIVGAQGLVLGAVVVMANARVPGVGVQAGILTSAVFASFLVGYRAGWLRLGERGKAIVIGLTAGIFWFYVIAFGLSFFGIRIPFLHEGGWLGIGFSLFATGLAAANLLLDFAAIDDGIRLRVDRSMEWAVALGLVLTIAWLYVEMLRLLGKLRR